MAGFAPVARPTIPAMQPVYPDVSLGRVQPTGSTAIADLRDHVAGWVNVKQYAGSSAVTGAHLASAAAQAVTDGTGVLIAHPVTISTALGTISAPVRWEGGGRLVFNTGGSVALTGPQTGGLGQRFALGTASDFSGLTSVGAVPKVYPQWWGAVGNGTTDDSAAFTAAIASSAKPTIYVPPGTYAIRNVLLKRGVTLRGAGFDATTLKNNGTSASDHTLYTTGAENYYLTISDLRFTWTQNVSQGHAMHLVGLNSSKVSRIFFEGSTAASYSTCESGGLYLGQDSYANTFDHFKVYQNKMALELEGATLHAVNANRFSDWAIHVRNGSYISAYFAYNNVFELIDAENTAGGNPTYDWSFIELFSSSFNEVRDSYFDGKNYGFSIIHLKGESNVNDWRSRGNVIRLNNINDSGNHGVYFDDYAALNTVENNLFASNTSDITIDAAKTENYYNRILHNVFKDGFGKITAAASRFPVLSYYNDVTDRIVMSSVLSPEKVEMRAGLHMNSQIIWSGTTAATGSKFLWGTGSPEGVVFGNRGSVFLRTDGGAVTTLYVKESGDGATTGWVAK